MRALVAISILLTVGCVERGQPHRPHAGAPRSKPEVAAPVEPTAANDPLMRAAGGSGDVNLLNQLGAELLRAEVLNDQAIWTKPGIARKLGRLNDELLVALRGGGELDPRARIVAAAYQRFALDVANLAFFRSSSTSASVITELAKRNRTDLQVYYRLLYTALEVKGRAFDGEWSRLFVDEARNFMAAAEPETARGFAHMLSTVMRHLSNRRLGAGARELVDKLGLADETERAKLVRFGVSADALIELLALSGENDEGRIEAHFARPESLKSVQENLLKSNGTMAAQLRMEKVGRWSRSLRLIDQAYLGELTVDQAIRLIRAETADRARLAREVRQAMTIRFLQTLARTSDEAQKRFFEREVAGPRFFFHAYYSASEVRPIWGEFSSRAAYLQKLSAVVLSSPDPQDKITRENRKLFAGIPLNIKYLSTYPTMMALAYHMSKRDAPVTIQTPWGDVRIEPETVIETLFLGGYKPWFDYSQDSKPLDFMEMLYAFDYALRAGVFQRYKVDPDDFVVELIDRLSRRSLREVRAYLTLLESRMGGENFRQFIDVCSGLETRTFQVNQTLKDLKFNPMLGVLGGEIFTSVSSKSSAHSRGANDKLLEGIMLFDSAFAGRTEEVRLDLDNISRWMEGLALSYRSYLERSAPAQIEEKMKSTNAAIAALREFRVQYLRRTAVLFRKVAPCYSKITGAEENLKLRLIQAEESHLRRVHADLTGIRAQETTPAQVKAKYQFRNLPSGFAGLDEYSADGYLYNSIDVLVRAAAVVKQWAPGISVNMGTRLDAFSPDVRDSEQVRIIYDDVEKFVAEGIRALLARPGFAPWGALGLSRLSHWDSLIHVAGVFSRVSDPRLLRRVCEIKGACGPDGTIVSVSEILQLHSDMLELVTIGDELRRYMSMASLYRRFDPLDLTRTMVDYSVETNTITRLWGLYDLPAAVMVKEVLGDTHSLQELSKAGGAQDPMMAAFAGMEAIMHVGFKKLARKYFEIRRQSSRQLFLFTVSETLDASLDVSVREFVARETGRMEDFGRELGALRGVIAARPAESRPRVDLSTVESIRGPVVSPNIMENHFQELEPFHRDTGYCFKNSTCAEFSGQ